MYACSESESLKYFDETIVFCHISTLSPNILVVTTRDLVVKVMGLQLDSVRGSVSGYYFHVAPVWYEDTNLFPP